MSTAGRLLSALQGPGNDLITGLIAYDQQRKEAELDRQERSLDREILLAQFEREGQAAKTEVLRAAFDASANRLQSVFDGLRDDTSLAGNEEYSQLMARTNANYLSERKNYFESAGIELPKSTDAFDIARAELAFFQNNPELGFWVDGKTDKLLRKKYEAQGISIDDELMGEIKIAWKASQPNASKEEQKRLDNLTDNFLSNIKIDGKTVDKLPDIPEGVLTAEEQGLESVPIAETIMLALPGLGLVAGARGASSLVKSTKLFKNLRDKLFPKKPVTAQRDPKDPQIEMFPGTTSATATATPKGILGRFRGSERPRSAKQQRRDEERRQREIESASRQLNPALANALKKTAGYGLLAGGLGVASEVFADPQTQTSLNQMLGSSAGEGLSDLPPEVVDQLRMTEQEFLNRGLVPDSVDPETTVDQVQEFLRQYQIYLAEFGEDQAEELLEQQFQTLPLQVQEEILQILQ